MSWKNTFSLFMMAAIFCSAANAASLSAQSTSGKEVGIYVEVKNGYKSVDISSYTGWVFCDFDAKTFLKNSKEIELAHLKCHTKTKQQILVSCQSNEKIEVYLGDSNSLNEDGGILIMQCNSR